MEHYRRSSHAVYDLKYHLVWITKYRKLVLQGPIATRVRELIREIGKSKDVEIVKGHRSRDHVHLFVSVPPNISVSDMLKSVKGKTRSFGPRCFTFWNLRIWHGRSIGCPNYS
jgi:putative transposase